MSDRWTPGIGDPGAIGWFTVAAYLATAAGCGLVARRHAGGRRVDVTFWAALALMMLALGINKQLDLQSLLTQQMRDAAQAHGWYAERRILQAAFIFAIGLTGVMLAIAGWWWMPMLHRNMRIALLGLIFVYTYVMIRASSFHHVDVFIGTTLFGMKGNWILEIGGIVVVGYAGAREWRWRGGLSSS